MIRPFPVAQANQFLIRGQIEIAILQPRQPAYKTAGMPLNRKATLTAWLVVGIVLALGPILGTLPSAIGMAATFRNLDQGGAQEAIFEESVRVGMWLTIAGLLVCPVGIAIVVVSAVKLSRSKNQ